MRQPYIGTENRGILMESDENLIKQISDADATGFRLEIHAIGECCTQVHTCMQCFW